MNQNTFTIGRFINQSGTSARRVSGWTDGIRLRKNFKSKAEAAAEKSTLELKALQAASGIRSSATFLSDDQLREAEAAFRRIGGQPRSLTFYLDYALANYREPERDVPLAAAAAQYVATKAKELELTFLSIRQFRSIKNERAILVQRFPAAPLSQFAPASLRPYLERNGASFKTYNNRRGLLSTFFKFALQRDWVAANPIEKTPHHRIGHPSLYFPGFSQVESKSALDPSQRQMRG